MKADSCNLYQNWNLCFNLHQRNYVVGWVNCYGVTEIPIEQCFDDSQVMSSFVIDFCNKKKQQQKPWVPTTNDAARWVACISVLYGIK